MYVLSTTHPSLHQPVWHGSRVPASAEAGKIRLTKFYVPQDLDLLGHYHPAAIDLHGFVTSGCTALTRLAVVLQWCTSVR